MSGIFGLIYKYIEDTDLIYKMSIPYRNNLPIDYIFIRSAALGVRRKPFGQGKRDVYGFTNDRKIHVIISGEITNRDEILELIQQDTTIIEKNIGDAEILARLFKKYGIECIKKIDGQFCAALLDENEETLYLMVDRIGGFRNIFYSITEKGFLFATTIHSILSIPWIKREIEINSFIKLFTSGFILPPKSLIKNINKLCPGEVLIYKNFQTKSKIIDRINFDSTGNKKTTKNELYNKLSKAIKRLSFKEDVGFLLSGGIDSSSIVAIASKELNKKIKTFCASFPGTTLDESFYAKIVAKAYSCNNHFIELSHDELLDDLPFILWNLDEPFLDYSVIPVFHLFKKIKEGTSIIISGDGPDHLFGRYYPLAAKRYIANKIGFLNQILNKIPIKFLKKIARVANCTLKKSYNEIFIIPTWGIENVNTMMDLFSTEIQNTSIQDYDFLKNFVGEENSFIDIFDLISYLDFYIDGSHGVFTKIGKMALANDIIVREPYLSRDVSDFIASLPLHDKIRGNSLDILLSNAKSKYLLKYELALDILPIEIIHKRKGGFTPPLGKWLKEKICKMPIEKIFCKTILEGFYFNKSYLKKIFSEHLEGKRNWSTLIFMMISFDIWMRMIIEKNFESFPKWKLFEIYDS